MIFGLALLMTGCQRIGVRPLENLSLTQPILNPAILNPELAMYSRELNQDDWSSNPSWNIAAYWQANRAPEGNRWSYGNGDETEQLVTELLQPASTTISIAISSDPIDDRRRPHSAPPEPIIAKLARMPSLSGWNAAILWGHVQPEAAHSVAPTLESIVLGELRYHTLSPPVDKKGTSKSVPVTRGQSPSSSPTSVRDNVDSRKATWLDSVKESATSWTYEKEEHELSLVMRAAAAEAWCRVLTSKTDVDPIEQLAPVGRALADGSLPAAIKSELFRSVARDVSPGDIPGIDEALTPADEVTADRALQQAALEACLIYAWENVYQPQRSIPSSEWKPHDEALWPASVHHLRLSRDPKMREYYAYWLVYSNHPEALDHLKRQMTDTDKSARSASYRALGMFSSGTAIETLNAAAKSSNLIERQNAVRGLAMISPQLIIPYLNDDEMKVRQTALEELLQQQDASQVVNIRKQFLDPRNDIHLTIINGLNDWPDHLALPIYLYGMQECPILTTRKACLEKIRQRTKTEETFPVEEMIAERRSAANAWADRHEIPQGETLEAVVQTAAMVAKPAPYVQQQDLGTRLRVLAQKTPDDPAFQTEIQRLTQLNEQDALLLEQLTPRQPPQLQQELRTRVLPVVHPVYKAATQLDSPQVNIRRQGALQLQMISERRSMPEDIFPQIRDRMLKEQDQFVWRAILKSYERDRTAQSGELARIALHHAWPDIKLLGCEYIEFDPRPEYAEWLRPMIHDRQNRRLRLQAIRLAGRCQNPNLLNSRYPTAPQQLPEEQGLVSLLNETEPELRFEVVVAASQLGYPPAMQELAVLAQHPELQVRLRAIQAMATSGQTRFAEQLILIGSNEKHPQAQREMMSALKQLMTFGTQPPADIDR
ncbi:MAG: hypothetical protein CMJ46_02645, partial [Planctomyces sp.]|nr:hypothetical protein [Planctomyces sp.]